MDLTGKRFAILLDLLYQEMEVWYPYYRLIEAGAEVHFVAAEANKTYTSKLGYPAKSHKTYDEVNASDYHGVICPGGFSPDYIRRYPKANQFVADLHAQDKLVAAICHGLWCWCSAGVLKGGKRCTSYFSIKDDVINAGGLWEDAEVVVDGNLVSSRRPDDLPAFMKACLAVAAKG